MFRESFLLLGRWKRTDFMKGRSRKQGSVHTKSTIGGRGRFVAYYKKYASRDGRSGELNNNKGELGVRFFGGFHGNRTPLGEYAFLEKDTLELSIYGHDSITNPFRGILAKHPNLDALVAGPAGRAILALPVGMWNQQQRQASSRNENNNNNNTSDFFSLQKELRIAERNFVISSATNFLLDFFFSKSASENHQQTWSEKSVLLSGKRRSDGLNCSVVISAAELYQEFWDMNYSSLLEENVQKEEGEQQQKKNEAVQSDSEVSNEMSQIQRDEFEIFVEGAIREIYRKFTSHNNNNNAAQIDEERKLSAEIFQFATEKIQPDIRLIQAISNAAPNSLRCIVENEISSQRQQNNNQLKKKYQESFLQQQSSSKSSSNSSSPNEILKWYLRTHDPRRHFGSINNNNQNIKSGHSNAQFTLVVLQSFLPMYEPILNAVKKNGFQSVSPGISSDDFFRISSDVILDDTNNRVGIYGNNNNNEKDNNVNNDSTTLAEGKNSEKKKKATMIPASASEKNSVHLHHYFVNEKRPEEISMFGQERADPWTSNDNDGTDGRSFPFPHLFRQRHYDEKEMRMVGGARNKHVFLEKENSNKSPQSAKIYAKSYFCSGL